LNDTELMQIAIDQAVKGMELGDQPFGAVLAKDGEVIHTGRNVVNSTFDPTAHAETVALRDASTSTKTLSFPGATLYASWEPCPMCLGAIMAAGISRLVLGGRRKDSENQYNGYTVEKLINLANFENKLSLTTGVLQVESEEILNIWRSNQN
jgi:tRNA(adenine34) deaminase